MLEQLAQPALLAQAALVRLAPLELLGLLLQLQGRLAPPELLAPLDLALPAHPARVRLVQQGRAALRVLELTIKALSQRLQPFRATHHHIPGLLATHMSR